MRIGIVGDFDPTHETHVDTGEAIGHAAASLGVHAESEWIGTDVVEREGVEVSLARFDGLLIAPGSPYRSMAGALRAIEHARRREVPLLGTCGGFQHVVLEYARNVLGFEDAQHAEYDPDASTLFVTPLSCSLAGRSMAVRLCPGTLAARSYGQATATERYYCNFGLNPAYLDSIVRGGLVVSATDEDGEARILELPAHPFYAATLFVPQTSSRPGSPHPMVAALVAAAAGAALTP